MKFLSHNNLILGFGMFIMFDFNNIVMLCFENEITVRNKMRAVGLI